MSFPCPHSREQTHVALVREADRTLAAWLAALTVEELGLNNGMAKATVDWQRTIGELKLDAGDLGYRERADMILEAMTKK